MKKLLLLIFMFAVTMNSVFADDFKTFYDNGQAFLNSSQYSSAISEFKKALRINYLDDSARIGIVNSYLARGTYYANNENNYDRAANDFRAALFYLKYYPEAKDVAISQNAIQTTTDNLEQCMISQGQSKLQQERYNRAVILRKNGELPAAAYEFMQAAQGTDKTIQAKSYAQIADIFSVLNHTKNSAIYYQKSVAIDPTNVNVRLKYARVLDKLGQDDLAVQEYNYILSKGSDNAEVLYALEKIYTKKLEQSPKSAELNANLGAILQREKKYDAALSYYKVAETLDSSSVTTRLNIGTLYQQKQDYPSALAAYNSVINAQPNNVEAHLYKAQVLVATGEKEEALKEFRKVLDIDPTSVVAKREMFDIMKDTMSPAQMLVALKADANVDKSSIEAMYEYAKELHNSKKLNEAIDCYSEVLKYDSSNPEYYANLALAYSQKRDYYNAEKVLNNAKIKYPNNSLIKTTTDTVLAEHASSKYTEANQYFTNNEYQKALSLYLSIEPKSKDVYIAIAACYKGLNNIDKSIEFYKKAFALDSNNSEIAYYIGVLYAEKENWTSAKIYLQNALKLDPKNTSADDLLSTVVEQNNVLLINKVIDFYNAKDYTTALKIISQILTEDNKNAYAFYYRGLIYDAQQKPMQAIHEYEKAIVNNPELVISDYLIATAYDSLGQYSNAYTHYKKFVTNSKNNDEYKKYAVSRLNDLKSYEKKVQ